MAFAHDPQHNDDRKPPYRLTSDYRPYPTAPPPPPPSHESYHRPPYAPAPAPAPCGQAYPRHPSHQERYEPYPSSAHPSQSSYSHPPPTWHYHGPPEHAGRDYDRDRPRDHDAIHGHDPRRMAQAPACTHSHDYYPQDPYYQPPAPHLNQSHPPHPPHHALYSSSPLSSSPHHHHHHHPPPHHRPRLPEQTSNHSQSPQLSRDLSTTSSSLTKQLHVDDSSSPFTGMDHSMRSPPSSFRQQKLAPAQSPPRDASAAPYSAATAASAAIKAETVLPEEEETYESSPSACHSRATIKIVQQPLHARMCGFGEKDRRPIDPPPIVQLILDEPNYNELHLPPSLKYAGLKGEASASKRGRKRLVGSRTSTRTTKVHNPSGVPTRNSIEKDTESHGEDAGSDDDEEAHPHNSLQSIDEHEDVGDRDHGMNEEDRDKDKHKRIRKREEDRDEDMDSSHGQESSESRRGSTASGSAPTAMAGMVSEILPLHQDPLYVLHCSLWSEDGTEVRSMISTPGKSDPPKLTRILMGSVVISPILLNNAEGEPGWYFSFPDLSIRTEGVYTLKFKLMCITSFDPMSEQATKLITEETSTSFTVYSAKKFPGMTESTELSKAFARQGLKIPIRNDLRPRKTESKD